MCEHVGDRIASINISAEQAQQITLYYNSHSQSCLPCQRRLAPEAQSTLPCLPPWLDSSLPALQGSHPTAQLPCIISLLQLQRPVQGLPNISRLIARAAVCADTKGIGQQRRAGVSKKAASSVIQGLQLAPCGVAVAHITDSPAAIKTKAKYKSAPCGCQKMSKHC